MIPEELLKKLDRLDKIPPKGYKVRGRPDSIQTVSVDGELLDKRFRFFLLSGGSEIKIRFENVDNIELIK